MPHLRARFLLKELRVDSCPVDPYAIAGQIGVHVSEDDVDGYAGMIILVEGRALISIRRSIREEAKKRFTVAHELGHYKIPGHLSPGVPSFRCTDEDLNTFQGPAKKEIEANRFAAELLMPEDAFLARIEGEDLGYQLVQELMEEFGTSLTATCLRFVQVERTQALAYSVDGKVKWVFRGSEFPHAVAGQGKLHSESAAMNFFRGNACSYDFETVAPDCWLQQRRAGGGVELRELALPLPHYNAVLSFLAVCDDAEESDAEESPEYGELDGILRFRK